MKNENEIKEKKEQIEKYKIILENYYGRWYDQGKRRLEQLEEELKILENHLLEK
jgi:hypothetical protein